MTDLFAYPHQPGTQDQDTSQAAAEAIAPEAHLLRGRALKPHPSLMARDGVAYVPEGRGVFPGLTVKEIFTLALWSASLGAGEGRARIDEVLEVLPKLKAQ